MKKISIILISVFFIFVLNANIFAASAFTEQLNSYNSSMWEMRDGTNGSPFNCGFTPQNISFSGGYMTLKLNNTRSYNLPFSGAEYRTKSTYSYGKFETSMKPAKSSGIVSSFFLYTGSPWDEIDIEFLGKNTNQVQFNYYVNGVGGHEKLIDLGFDASTSYHKYAIEYGNGYIKWYVDGVQKYSVSGGTLPSHPMQIMVNLWPGIGVDNWLGSFNYKNTLYASYDYLSYTPINTSVTTPQPTQAPGSVASVTSGGIYKIVNRNSGKVLDVTNRSTSDGAQIVQSSDYGIPSQQWQFYSLNNGYYKIINKNSGKVMDISGASSSNGANNVQWKDNGGNNQQWKLIDAGSGYFKIQNRNSGKLLDINGHSTADGASDIQWSDNGGNNQLWKLTKVN
ncbi:MAG: RICIN domain-containing protein [Bacillota bacterium]|nr:RICIN domain-containing protein [Bacillota bacterium]